MPIPKSPKPYYQKDALDNAIDVFAKKDKPTQADLDRVGTIANIQAGLDKYRATAQHMTFNQLQDEKHNSTRLGQHMEAADGKRRPPRCHAHAIISGGHSAAAQARAIMAWLQLRIDDPYNGCWLPENTNATPHPLFPNAKPHSRIHRTNYYRWVFDLVRPIKDQPRLIFMLKFIGQRLQHGTLPPHVMLPKSRV